MKWLLSLTVGAMLGTGVGCGTDPSGTSGGGSGGSTGTGGASPCDDPANGPVPETCGIWVSASLGDDANPGTQASPVASLAHAVELAKEQTGHVYACAETWSEPLVLPGNLGLHGGFDCADGWKYLGKDKRSTLAPEPDEVPLIVSDDGSGGKATVTDFHVEAAAAVKPSGSSIGIFVPETVTLWLYRCEVIAGNGADGLDGAPADPENKPAPDGPAGNTGADACSAAVSKGGTSPEAACETGNSRGGAGGDGSTMVAADGAAGEPATGNPDEGAGGLGEENSPMCTDGKMGADGAAGKDGAAALGFTSNHQGRLTMDSYLGTAGEDGGPGAPGQGGGGGGATFGSAAACGVALPGGAAGGSGGSGGCGAKGGGGGQPGGASIAVALRSRLAYFETQLIAGNGGKGGDGAPGQAGGSGGKGGAGGTGFGAVKPGCSGGMGGDGGRGGWGGGGQGGPAMPVALVEVEGNWQLGTDDTSVLFGGEGGFGGLGNPTDPATRGWQGNTALVGVLNP